MQPINSQFARDGNRPSYPIPCIGIFLLAPTHGQWHKVVIASPGHRRFPAGAGETVAARGCPGSYCVYDELRCLPRKCDPRRHICGPRVRSSCESNDRVNHRDRLRQQPNLLRRRYIDRMVCHRVQSNEPGSCKPAILLPNRSRNLRPEASNLPCSFDPPIPYPNGLIPVRSNPYPFYGNNQISCGGTTATYRSNIRRRFKLAPR
jgi:hypothetical protein